MKSSGVLFIRNVIATIFFLAILGAIIAVPLARAGDIKSMNAGKSGVVKHWTKERISNAIPRDLVIDQRGLGYMRKADGSFVPYGHQVAAETPVPSGKPPSGGDNTPPTIESMDPAEDATIAGAHTFSAIVRDESGIKSVSFVVRYPDIITTQTFRPSKVAEDKWAISLEGFTDGDWSWWVEAKDGAAKGGNRATSDEVFFSVDTGGSEPPPPPPPGSDTVINEVWSDGGAVQTAAGRIYFEMPGNKRRKGPWQGYVCSGTVVEDSKTDRSVILTAAHCVYDDINKAFARNVLFIPNQAGTSGSGTDSVCSNDPLGCWTPSFGVVGVDWTTRTFPANKEWDYAYYVVNDEGAHLGAGSVSILDEAAGALPVSFVYPYHDDDDPGAATLDFTHALGYSYSYDPNLMYCAEDMTTIEVDNWWLPSCELSGGSSGGPWIQPMDIYLGSGDVISVNSWGYTTTPGMAGPVLSDGSAECLFEVAKINWIVTNIDGDAGIISTCQ